MASLRQAVERLRDRGELPPSGDISLKDLNRRFGQLPPYSLRRLLARMLAGADKRPFAVILCRFKGSPPDPALEGPIEQFYREAFTPNSGGLVDYWRDASLAAIDVSGTKVFDWVEIDIARADAGGTPGTVPPGPGRQGLANAAVDALKRAHGNGVMDGFVGPIAIYTQNWSKNGVPTGTTWATPGWLPFWIDGSSSGGVIELTPPHDGNVTAHEMGHVFGMQHDYDVTVTKAYSDPCCIMSQNNGFLNPPWMRNFGPAICLPHLVQRDWMYHRRLYVDDGDWMTQPDGITIPLAPLTRPEAAANLGIKLAFRRGDNAWDYYIQCQTPTGWDRGLLRSYVFVRRIASTPEGVSPIILGGVFTPDTVGASAEYVEPTGNVRFRVELSGLPGPVVMVNVAML
jgi:M6 family metalloprotease-like protein